MPEAYPGRTARELPGLLALCLFLGLLSVLLLGAAAWFLFRGAGLEGGLSLALAVLLAAAAFGIYRLKRWGVILFGILSAIGSANHLAQTFFRATLTFPLRIQPGGAAALLSILIAILIPIGLIYLALLLWKQSR